MWLFGKLQTVGANEAEARAEASARAVEEGLRKLAGGGGGGGGGGGAAEENVTS